MITASLTGTRFAVVDVETTGLSAKRHRVVQVAVVTVLADGTRVDEWSSVVRKPRWRRVGARHIHGLSSSDLRDAPAFAHIAPELVRRLDGSIVVAHNAGFDWSFLRRELARAGYAVPDAARLCTLRLSRTLDPDRQQSHRLPEVAQRYGVPCEHLHDALADAETTAALLPRLLDDSQADALDQLRPALRGTTTAWPAYERVRWPRRLTRRLRPSRANPARHSSSAQLLSGNQG
jgi:DNA polymerase III epsilon subunit family exonuclease